LGPRINAGGRIRTPYDSLNILINTGAEQIPYLEKLEEINTERKQLQEDALTCAKENLNTDNHLIFSVSKEYNE
jgi:single-stranded DNA-specific DHH superfamily exonuclease